MAIDDRRVSRRRFLRQSALGAGDCAFGSHIAGDSASARQGGLPLPADDQACARDDGNRRSITSSAGCRGRTTAAQAFYLDGDGQLHRTHALAPDYQGCGHPDPDHSYEGGRIEYNDGACDGWLRAGQNDEFAIGFYGPRDLSFLAGAAPDWIACDRYFAAIMAETFPNRIYQHAAQTDRLSNTFEFSILPTIWDRLAERGLTGRYYFSDVPLLALWGTKYIPISRPYAAFLADCAAGTLPAVSYVDPRFVDEESGTSGDDHPHADIRNGEAFLNQVYTAVTQSPAWPNTLLVINYDEWGGFFDHVPPPTAAIPPADAAAGNADGRLGFRVPCLLISPWSLRSQVTHTQFDHTSILNLIEWRWDLDPLTVRDATANNPATVLDLGRPKLHAPSYQVPAGPFGGACPSLPGAAVVENEWTALQQLARTYGWPI